VNPIEVQRQRETKLRLRINMSESGFENVAAQNVAQALGETSARHRRSQRPRKSNSRKKKSQNIQKYLAKKNQRQFPGARSVPRNG